MKKILITIDSLRIGGAEKSLITLLGMLDYSKYDVDLQLFSYSGELMSFIPKEVNVLPLPEHNRFFSQPIHKKILSPVKFFRQLKYSLKLRRPGISNSKRNLLFWDLIKPYVPRNPVKYDLAIAYSQGVPTFYTAECVSASKKLGWINAFIIFEEDIKSKVLQIYSGLDMVIAVSEELRRYLLTELFSDSNYKVTTIRDILDANTIRKLSSLECRPLKNDFSSVIMTVGRLDIVGKGYDIALKAAVELRKRGVLFKWYVVGDGPQRNELQEYINTNEMEDYFILLGASPNPYPLMKQCDVYVQTSRKEGFGLTVAEARILNRPVVCTEFRGSNAQIKHGTNGLLTSFNPIEIADKIETLLKNEELYRTIQKNQKEEKIDNSEEIEKFYKLIEE